jgi:HAMP domain-containing protein
MGTGIKRRKYLIHPSSQLKYIEMTVLPALVLSLFCIYFLIKNGEIFLAKEKTQLSLEVSYLDDTIQRLNSESYPADTIKKIEVLKKRLSIMQHNLEGEYFGTLRLWTKTKMVLFLFLAIAIFLAGLIALILSHRIAGPISRLRNLAEMLAEGKDVPPVKFRNYDEFKEVAAAFEKLRNSLKAKGMLK